MIKRLKKHTKKQTTSVKTTLSY